MYSKRYQTAFYSFSLALNTRSTIHLPGCVSTTCEAPGYLTQGLEETQVLLMQWLEGWEDVPGHAKGYWLPLWG